MISKQKALTIATDWHGGQWSAFYSFISTKQIFPEKIEEYIWECNANITKLSKDEPETSKIVKELNQLKEWFVYKKGELIAKKTQDDTVWD